MNVKVQENLSASSSPCYKDEGAEILEFFGLFVPVLLKHSRNFFQTLKTASLSQVLQSRTFCVLYTCLIINCKRFEPRSHLISRLSMIVRVNFVLNRTVVDSN